MCQYLFATPERMCMRVHWYACACMRVFRAIIHPPWVLMSGLTAALSLGVFMTSSGEVVDVGPLCVSVCRHVVCAALWAWTWTMCRACARRLVSLSWLLFLMMALQLAVALL